MDSKFSLLLLVVCCWYQYAAMLNTAEVDWYLDALSDELLEILDADEQDSRKRAVQPSCVNKDDASCAERKENFLKWTSETSIKGFCQQFSIADECCKTCRDEGLGYFVQGMEKNSGFNSATCPSGWTIVTDKNECQGKVTEDMNKSFREANPTDEFAAVGCFNDPDNYISFQTKAGSKTGDFYSPICKREKVTCLFETGQPDIYDAVSMGFRTEEDCIKTCQYSENNYKGTWMMNIGIDSNKESGCFCVRIKTPVVPGTFGGKTCFFR